MSKLSVPVAVSTCHKPQLARSQNLWEETFLRLTVDRLRAGGLEAVWLCDRGFLRAAWLKRLLDSEQDFVVRLQRDMTVHLPSGACLLKQLRLAEGERSDFGFVSVPSDGAARVRLIGGTDVLNFAFAA